jgi:hypothetical protein
MGHLKVTVRYQSDYFTGKMMQHCEDKGMMTVIVFMVKKGQCGIKHEISIQLVLCQTKSKE